MLCSKCGKQLQDDVSFCSYCGTKVNNIEPQNTSQKVNSKHSKPNNRETSIEQVKNLLNYFSQKSGTYNEFDKVTATLHNIRAGRSGTQKFLSRFFFLISSILLLLALSIAIAGIISNRQNNTLGGLANFSFGSMFFILFLILGIYSLAAGIVLFVVDNKRNNRYMNSLKFYSNRYFELSDELYLNYINYKDCPIKPEFTNPANIFVVQKTLLSGQADSVEEAVAVLSNSADKKIKAYSEQCASFAKKTAARFGRAKIACELNTIFLPGNYFSRR